VVDTQLADGETALLHLQNTTYYSLNLTGTHIWQGLKQGLTLRDISQHLQQHFAVDPEGADRSVCTFVQELVQHNLAQLRTDEPQQST
jgi:hypothetical protein